MAHVGQTADRLGIDEHGLDRTERAAVILLLRHGRPMGRESLAARLGTDLETYREVHEPWLERAGLLERTEAGRIATRRASDLYGDAAALEEMAESRAEAAEAEEGRRQRAEARRVLEEIVPQIWSRG